MEAVGEIALVLVVLVALVALVASVLLVVSVVVVVAESSITWRLLVIAAARQSNGVHIAVDMPSTRAHCTNSSRY